jgi:hypothetical protein
MRVDDIRRPCPREEQAGRGRVWSVERNEIREGLTHQAA